MASSGNTKTSNLDVKNLFNVDGIVAVVTGGGTVKLFPFSERIGLMLAKALAHNGAKKVYIIGRRADKLENAVREIDREGVVVALVGDITNQNSLKEMADKVRKKEGYINLLIPNAGIMGPKIRELAADCSVEEFVEHCWKTPMSEFTDTYNVNITGVYYTILAFLTLLDKGNKKQGTWAEGVNSQVVVVGSIAAFSRMKGASFAYNSSKAGVTHLCKHLSSYFGRWGVRVNVIAPGMYPSEMSTPLSGVADSSKAGAVPASTIPATRTGSEMDMAGVILGLVSRAGAYYNGAVMVTDGGRLGILPGSY